MYTFIFLAQSYIARKKESKIVTTIPFNDPFPRTSEGQEHCLMPVSDVFVLVSVSESVENPPHTGTEDNGIRNQRTNFKAVPAEKKKTATTSNCISELNVSRT